LKGEFGEGSLKRGEFGSVEDLSKQAVGEEMGNRSHTVLNKGSVKALEELKAKIKALKGDLIHKDMVTKRLKEHVKNLTEEVAIWRQGGGRVRDESRWRHSGISVMVMRIFHERKDRWNWNLRMKDCAWRFRNGKPNMKLYSLNQKNWRKELLQLLSRPQP